MTPRILALHGFTGCGEDFDNLKLQCPRDWQWLAPDLPGHGKNEMAPVSPTGNPEDAAFSLDAHLDFLDEKRHEAFGKKPCFLLGYSMGGRIALHLAMENPAAFAGVILISASPGIKNDTAREKRARSDRHLAKKIADKNVNIFIEQWLSLPIFQGLRNVPSSVLAAMLHRRRFNNVKKLAASLRGIGTGELPSLWGELPAVSFPLCLIVGIHDLKFVRIADKMKEKFPGAIVEKIPYAGHVVHVEQPGETAKAIIHFIHKITGK